uniref:Uncharacterized protein n=1 Tax=Avena sativa TaxID=4498 RepID=A0ACD5XG61_AVESA
MHMLLNTINTVHRLYIFHTASTKGKSTSFERQLIIQAMAWPSRILSLLCFSHFIVAMADPSFMCPIVPCEREINLRLYLHQVVDGPDHNQVVTVNSGHRSWFGTTTVIDWTVIDAPEPDATIVARAKGMQVQADLEGPGWFHYISMVFQDPRFMHNYLYFRPRSDFDK